MDNFTVTIEKLVHGGQGLATLPDGRKVFVWNALPGEVAKVRIIKKRRDYVEAVAEDVLEPSTERTTPKEEIYLSTSPWQIMTFEVENKYKKEIINEVFAREHVVLPDYRFTTPSHEYHYRNKMEYSFWGDDYGIHLALHKRGSHGKQIVVGSALALPSVDNGANQVLKELQKHNIRAGDLKTVIVRANQTGEAAASLFVKNQDFIKLALPSNLNGLAVYYSNPKSPASVPTKLMYKLGDTTIQDTLLGKSFEYNSDSFFQVNLPIFEQALSVIKKFVYENEVVDMYGGVGSIGLGVSNNPTIIELDDATAKMAIHNTKDSDAKVIQASSEKALDYIIKNKILIVDPPRAGLHKNVINRILHTKPKKVIYLSCNPATQARDIKLLESNYLVSFFEGYNFFPRTPHIETLAVMELV